MPDDMKKLESQLKKGVNKRNALSAMGGGGKQGKGKKVRRRQQRRRRTRAGQ